jgi:hypothetical protein
LPSQSPTYTKLTDRGISFGLLRTNPKLTSNVKLTIDSAGGLWFNSIDATSELAQNKYKNFPIDPASAHEVNLFKFYDFGKTPTKISFAIGSTITIDTVAKDLKDQFDFDLYSSGAKYLTSKNYSEKFSYLAPLYLDAVVPEAFVIFKVPGASNYTVGEWKQKLADPTFDRKTFSLDLFRKAVAVKAFDLTENSKIGKYIRNITKNPMYTKNPLYINFKEDRYSVYRGSSIGSGTYVEIPELLSSTLRKSIPQLKLEQYITEGFERNNIIHPRILNLEFLFNDDTSEDYTFNRYFGFYCNLIELAQFDIDLQAMHENQDNDNPLSATIRKDDDLTVTITNSDGVVLRGIGVDTDLTAFDAMMNDRDSIFFPYLKLRDDSLRFPQVQSMEEVGNRIKFSIHETSLDLGLTFGPGELFSQETAKSSSIDTRSTVSIQFTSNPEHLETLRIFHQNGSIFDPLESAGRYDDIVFVDDPTASVFPNGEEYWLTYPNNNNGASRIYVPTKVSGKSKDLATIAKTVLEIVKKLKSSFLTGKTFDSTMFVQILPVGNHYLELAVKALGTLSSRVLINGKTTSSVVYADGGMESTKQAIIPIGNIDRLTPILDQIVVKTEKDWSTILRVSNSSVSIDENEVLTDSAVSSYFANATLELKDNEPTEVLYDRIEIRKLYKPKIGVLSIFEIKDIDFYTYSTNYAKIPEIDLYQYYYVPKNTKILDFTKYVYKTVGAGEIKVNDITYTATGGVDTIVWQNSEGLHEYSVLNGDVILTQSSLSVGSQNWIRQDIPILDEDRNLLNFTGFFSFGADHSSPDPTALTYEYREKYKANNLISEYHVYLENFSTDFSNTNRVIPYISKWGIIDSTDARGNPYRLNSDIMFGKDNFGPSHHETSPTPEKLTHEWFYIESDFNYSLTTDLVKKNNYYFPDSFNTELMISDSAYFEKYFTYIPMSDGVEIDRPQFRYSKLAKDQFTKQYATIFNGAKFVFSELSSDGSILDTTDRFEDYNFSVLLKPVKEDLQSSQLPIKYRIIENKDAKSIVILIELAVSDVSEISPSLLHIPVNPLGEVIFPDLRIDQTTVFQDQFIIIEFEQDKFPVQYQYLTKNTVGGDAIFDTILNSNYPSFSNDDFKNEGFVIDLKTNTPIVKYIPKPGDTFVVTKIADASQSYIIAFAESALFTMASSSKLTGISLNYLENPPQYLTLSEERLCYLTDSASRMRILKDAGPTLKRIPLSSTYDLMLNRLIPGLQSIFGDYRISFNDNEVSNLTYNFLYSAKDKKYNTTKSAYSNNKLSIGVDISTQGVVGEPVGNPSSYFLAGKTLSGVQTTEFKLEDFINPVSGSHDTLLNDSVPGVSKPLLSFSPLMFVSSTGKVSVVLTVLSSVDLNNSVTLPTDLSDPSKTNHAISRVSENLLTLSRLSGTDVIVLDVALIPSIGTGYTLSLSPQSFPSGYSGTWLIDSQQFQLFGGKGYFANLFENLSFATFASLLDKKSDLIFLETYENGNLANTQQIQIKTEQADSLNKATVVTSIPITVETASKKEVGGFDLIEDLSASYELYRYSGEYEIVFRPVAGFQQEITTGGITFTGANVFLNPTITDFFVIPEFSYVKYADYNILDFENFQKFEPVYPMIYESPIDFDKYEVLSSSWDFNYHYVYGTKKNKDAIPGSRRVTEDYSFISKLLNVPLSFIAESFTFVELTNQEFEVSDSDFLKLTVSGNLVEFAYSVYASEVRFKINFPQVVAKALSELGLSGDTRLRAEFQKFFTDENGQPIVTDPVSLGTYTFDSYLYDYCKTNLVKLYSFDTIDFYEKADYTLPDNSISFAEVPYEQLDDAGYSSIKSVKINNTTNSDIITGSIMKKSSSGVSLVPKLKIKYI